MEKFDQLLEIAAALHGPNGCPWDKEQTYESLRPYVLEEAHELLEAIDEGNLEGMIEELGDVLFQVIFFAKLGEKAGDFTLEDIITRVSEKFVHRHPHVFGDVEAKDVSDVMRHWEKAKGEEKKDRKDPLEGIPKTLGALARAQKVVAKMIRKELAFPEREKTLGDELLALVIQAEEEGIDAESALRYALKKYEHRFKS